MVYGKNTLFVIIQEKDFIEANGHIGMYIDVIYVPKNLKEKWDANHNGLKSSLLPCLVGGKGKIIFI